MENARKNKKQLLPQLRNISGDITLVVQFLYCRTKFLNTFFMWQYRAGVGAGAKIRAQVETELEPKINNFGSATLKKSPAVFGGHMVSPYCSYLRNDLTQHPVAILGVEEHDRLPVGSCKGKHSQRHL